MEGFKPTNHDQWKHRCRHCFIAFFYELGLRSNSGLLMEVGSKSNNTHDVRTDVSRARVKTVGETE